MLLHGQLCGRVGRRRFLLDKTPVSPIVRRGFCVSRSGWQRLHPFHADTEVITALFRADIACAPASLVNVPYTCIGTFTSSWLTGHLNSKKNSERSAAPIMLLHGQLCGRVGRRRFSEYNPRLAYCETGVFASRHSRYVLISAGPVRPQL